MSESITADERRAEWERFVDGITAAWQAGASRGFTFTHLIVGQETAVRLGFGETEHFVAAKGLTELAIRERLGADVVHLQIVPDGEPFPPDKAMWTTESWDDMKAKHAALNA